jgi:hypothetical protein
LQIIYSRIPIHFMYKWQVVVSIIGRPLEYLRRIVHCPWWCRIEVWQWRSPNWQLPTERFHQANHRLPSDHLWPSINPIFFKILKSLFQKEAGRSWPQLPVELWSHKDGNKVETKTWARQLTMNWPWGGGSRGAPP